MTAQKYNWEPADHYDVLLIAHADKRVHGLVGFHLHKPQAGELRQKLRANVSQQFFLAVVPAGTQANNSLFVKAVKQRTSKRNHGTTTFSRRQADHVCIICESPNLVNRLYCEVHQNSSNRRIKSQRK